MSALIGLLAVAAAVFVCAWILVSWLTRGAKLEYDGRAKDLEMLARIPLDEARMKAEALLERADLFRCLASPVSASSLPAHVAPELRTVLSQYQAIETAAGPSTGLDRSRLQSAEPMNGLLFIGTGMKGTDVQYEIAIRPGREDIVELHPGEEPDPTFGSYPSIHHWLLALAAEVEEARK